MFSSGKLKKKRFNLRVRGFVYFFLNIEDLCVLTKNVINSLALNTNI